MGGDLVSIAIDKVINGIPCMRLRYEARFQGGDQGRRGMFVASVGRRRQESLLGMTDKPVEVRLVSEAFFDSLVDGLVGEMGFGGGLPSGGRRPGDSTGAHGGFE